MVSFFVYYFIFFTPSPSSPYALNQTCLSSPNSQGCKACNLGGEYVDRSESDSFVIDEDTPSNKKESASLCAFCENEYMDVARNGLTGAEVDEKCKDL